MPDDKEDLDDKTAAQSGEAESSTADEQETVESSASESSTEEKDEKTLSDVVKDAAKGKATDSSTDGEGEAEEKADENTDLASEADAEKDKDKEQEPDDSKLPFNKHPRFQQIIKERNGLKEDASRLKPLADQSRALSDYCSKNGISDQ